jgi:hypothetical protein
MKTTWLIRIASVLALASLALGFPAAHAESNPSSSACRVLDGALQVGYRGGCRNGLAQGEGRAEGQTAVYEGSFHAGRKQGWGRWQLPNGDLYAGDFDADLPHGKGLYLWRGESGEQGNRYSGEFRAGKKHGQGVLLTAQGDRYEGRWIEDARGGQSATEIQFQRRYQAQSRAIETGGCVCREYQVGIGGSALRCGTVEARNGGMLTIRLDPQQAESLNADPMLPALMQDESLMAWQPC